MNFHAEKTSKEFGEFAKETRNRSRASRSIVHSGSVQKGHQNWQSKKMKNLRKGPKRANNSNFFSTKIIQKLEKLS